MVPTESWESTLASVWLPDLTHGTLSSQNPLGRRFRFHRELSYFVMYILDHSSGLPEDTLQPVVQPACCAELGKEQF